MSIGSSVAVLLILSGCAEQRAEVSRNVEARAGETTKIGQASRWDAQCNRSELPEIRIVEAPANGAVEVRPSVGKVETVTFGSTSCLGRDVEGMGVFYTPRQGFRGADRVRYMSIFAGAGSSSSNVTISVR